MSAPRRFGRRRYGSHEAEDEGHHGEPRGDVATFARLFDDAPIGVIVVDPQGCIAYVNRRQSEQSKLPVEDLVGRDYRATFGPSLERAGLMTKANRLLDEGESFEFTLPRYRRLADDALISMSSRGWRYGNSVVVLTTVDRELARHLGRYEQLFENANDGIFILDTDARFVAVNQSFASIVGIPREDLLGRTTESLLPGRHEESLARLQRILDEGRFGPYELEIESPRGRRTVSLNGFALIEDGHPVGIMNIARDVTEAAQATRELREARDQALMASQLKTSFLANMSHEIRTPLNVILGFTQLLEEHFDEVGDDDTRAQFRAIDRNGRRLLQTIGGILDISRIETGTFEYDPREIDVATVVRTMTGDFRPLAAEKGLHLVTRIVANRTVVRFDEHCLVQTLNNLLGNAIKFTEQGGVTVRLKSGDTNGLLLQISDTGIGMSSEFLRRVFEPFTQEESGSSRRFEGSGLGLPLAKRYVEINGGRLDLKSKKGWGTTVTIVFPDHGRAEDE